MVCSHRKWGIINKGGKNKTGFTTKMTPVENALKRSRVGKAGVLTGDKIIAYYISII